MGFAIMIDKNDAVPVNIHRDSCHYYMDRKLDATSVMWCHTDTLETAEELAKMLMKSKGCKRADCCLDNATLT